MDGLIIASLTLVFLFDQTCAVLIHGKSNLLVPNPEKT
jgi:hypothetical protein